MSDISSTFQQIIDIVRDIAPAAANNFFPPASEKKLASLAARTPELPDDLFALLRLHDGEGKESDFDSLLPNGVMLMGVDVIIDLHDEEIKMGRFSPKNIHNSATPAKFKTAGPVKAVFDHATRVPFADGPAEIWLIDLDPAPGGQIGQIVRENYEADYACVIAPSLSALFERYLTELMLARGKFMIEDEQIFTADSKSWPAV